MEEFILWIKKSIEKDTFARMTMSKYKGKIKGLNKIIIRYVEIAGELKFSFKYRFETNDMVKNFEVEEGIALIRESLSNDFKTAYLATVGQDVQLIINKRKQSKLLYHKTTVTKAPSRNHDKEKNHNIGSGESYLHHLGITTVEGKVKANKNDKYRQINKFIEITDSVYRSSDAFLKEKLKIVDMGSGKSYLTFALYDYFAVQQKIACKITGFEQRPELVELSNEVAEKSGFKKLSFVEGSIQDARTAGSDLLVALHACDTATDDALFQAIKNEIEMVIVAPCCHHYVRQNMIKPQHLEPILKHGILHERMAVTATDALRALTLEAFGYQTKVFEFIDAEHTDKNVMITGVLNPKATFNEAKLQEINELKNELGVKDFYLDELLFDL